MCQGVIFTMFFLPISLRPFSGFSSEVSYSSCRGNSSTWQNREFNETLIQFATTEVKSIHVTPQILYTLYVAYYIRLTILSRTMICRIDAYFFLIKELDEACVTFYNNNDEDVYL